MAFHPEIEYINKKRKRKFMGGITFLLLVSLLFILGVIGICAFLMVVN